MVALIKQETVSDYSLRTGLSERTVYKRIKEGKLKASKVKPYGSGNHYWLIETRIEANELYMIHPPPPPPGGEYEQVSYDFWGPGGRGER
jgi:hypothetical protein